MGNIEYRKLGGAGESQASLNLSIRLVDKLKWKRGDYIVIELDEFRQQLVLRKAKDR
jgi:hypothetical protein